MTSSAISFTALPMEICAYISSNLSISDMANYSNMMMCAHHHIYKEYKASENPDPLILKNLQVLKITDRECYIAFSAIRLIDAEKNPGKTAQALTLAALKKNKLAVSFLLEHSSIISKALGFSLEIAYRSGQLDMVQEMLNYSSFSQASRGWQILFQDVAKQGDLDFFQKLLDDQRFAHQNPIVIAACLSSALKIAALNGHAEIVKHILDDKGIHPFLALPTYKNSLKYALEKAAEKSDPKHLEIVREIFTKYHIFIQQLDPKAFSDLCICLAHTGFWEFLPNLLNHKKFDQIEDYVFEVLLEQAIKQDKLKTIIDLIRNPNIPVSKRDADIYAKVHSETLSEEVRLFFELEKSEPIKFSRVESIEDSNNLCLFMDVEPCFEERFVEAITQSNAVEQKALAHAKSNFAETWRVVSYYNQEPIMRKLIASSHFIRYLRQS